eukprot:3923956-Rhodomonas_salina.1
MAVLPFTAVDAGPWIDLLPETEASSWQGALLAWHWHAPRFFATHSHADSSPSYPALSFSPCTALSFSPCTSLSLSPCTFTPPIAFPLASTPALPSISL